VLPAPDPAVADAPDGTALRFLSPGREEAEAVLTGGVPTLRAALDNILDGFVADLLAANAALCAPKKAERVEPEAADICEVEPIPVIFFPDYRATNPYQRLLYDAFPEVFEVRADRIETALRLQTAGDRRHPVVFHLHWTSPVIGLERAEAVARRRIEAFVSGLEAFVAAGGVLIWTVHNVLPHETALPDLDAELCARIAALATAVHVHSPQTPGLAAEVFKLPPERTFVGQHGSYVGAYRDETTRAQARAQLGLGESATVFLCLGQIRAYKGIGDLLDAFEGVARTHPEAVLVIAGDVVNMDAAVLSARAATMRNVRLIARHIEDDALQVYFRAADFSVLPYRNVLTSGSVYLALSFGVPPIAPDRPLIAEVVRDGDNGLTYSATAPGALGDALRRAAVLSPVDRTRMGLQARVSADGLGWRQARTMLAAAAMAGSGGVRTIDVAGARRVCIVREVASEPGARVAAIVLHYRHTVDTMRCVASLRAQHGVAHHVFIVSNDETADAFCKLSDMFPQCTVIQSPDNLGFAGGNNLGLAMARERGFEFVWIVNPDVVAPLGTMKALVDAADLDTEAIAFGPAILFGDRPDTVWFAGGEIHWAGGLDAKHLHIGRPADTLPSRPFDADYLTGASLFFRLTAVDEVGYIPQQYFLYFEETHWCEMLRRRGHALRVIPDIRVSHFKRSEDRGAPTDIFLYYYCRNALLMCLAFEEKQIEATAQRIRGLVSIWLERVAMARPAGLGRARAAAEAGLADGHEGVSGFVDLDARLKGLFDG
jgi:GT2 family glycosyltransferase/glycosyltransferase involved in cell wall biosynthesis